MKLLFFTGSRSEWGYIRPILKICKKNKIKYEICATNMHLLDSFGNSVKEIEKEIAELTEDGSPYWNKTHPNHKKTVDQVFKLREQLNG